MEDKIVSKFCSATYPKSGSLSDGQSLGSKGDAVIKDSKGLYRSDEAGYLLASAALRSSQQALRRVVRCVTGQGRPGPNPAVVWLTHDIATQCLEHHEMTGGASLALRIQVVDRPLVFVFGSPGPHVDYSSRVAWEVDSEVPRSRHGRKFSHVRPNDCSTYRDISEM